MFGFLKNNDLRALNQRMGRFLNSFQYSGLEAERQRTESRIGLADPCIAFRFCETNDPRSYAIGITRDVSLHGMSMFVEAAMEPGDYVLILGEGEDRVMLKATCKRSVRERYGMHSVGFVFSKVLSERDYPAILKAVAYLESLATDQGEPLSEDSPREVVLSR